MFDHLSRTRLASSWLCAAFAALGACASGKPSVEPGAPAAGTLATLPASDSAAGGAGATPAGASSSAATRGSAGAAADSSSRGGAAGRREPAGAGAEAAAGDDGAEAGAAASAGTGGASADSGLGAPAATGSFPAVTSFTEPGPFAGTTLELTGPNMNYTVYMPSELPGGLKSPIVGWMSGGGTTPSGYPLLPHLATHGFVVVASNTAPAIGDEMSLGLEIIAGIDWAISENTREGSPLFGRLDETKIASMGYSMGSLATFTIAQDARLVTTVHISGGNMVAERVNNLHAPAAFFCGTPGDENCNILSGDCDIAAANCDIDFANAMTPVFYANFAGGHLGILTPPTQELIHAEVTAWLRWKLLSDATLESRFVGEQCGVCQDPNWKVQQKNL